MGTDVFLLPLKPYVPEHGDGHMMGWYAEAILECGREQALFDRLASLEINQGLPLSQPIYAPPVPGLDYEEMAYTHTMHDAFRPARLHRGGAPIWYLKIQDLLTLADQPMICKANQGIWMYLATRQREQRVALAWWW